MSKKLDHWIVYALFDPITGAIRYVGQTSYQLTHRLSRHLYEAKHRQVCDAKRVWVLGLIARGLRPEIKQLCLASTESEAGAKEAAQIAEFIASGTDLLNESDGGSGSHGRVLRDETKAKISAAATNRESPMKGMRHSPESIELMRNARIGKPNAMKGKKHPPEFGDKLRAIHTGRIHPLKGRAMSAETKAKISAAKMGVKRGPNAATMRRCEDSSAI